MTFPGDKPDIGLNFEVEDGPSPHPASPSTVGASGQPMQPHPPLATPVVTPASLDPTGGGSAAAGWAPPKSHDGSAIDPDDVFFVPPEPRLGDIISGATNVNRNYKAGVRSTWGASKVLAALFGSFLGACLGFFIGAKISDVMFLVLGSTLSVVGFFGLSSLKKPLHRMTLAGTAGFATYTRKGFRGRVKAQLGEFDQATELRIQNIRHYTNGTYTGDTFNYAWYHGPKRQFSLAGRYYAPKNRAVPKDNPVYLAWAAEREWSVYRLPVVLDRVERGEVVHFKVGKKDAVGVGNGFLELNFKGQSQRVSAADIQAVQVTKGEMTITLNDAQKGLFSSRGVFKVGVSKTSDFRLMILLIERELGIRVY